MLAHLFTSASSYSQASWRATDGGIFHRSTVEGAHRLTFVCARALPPSLQTQARTQSASDMKPGPDVGMAAKLISLLNIWLNLRCRKAIPVLDAWHLLEEKGLQIFPQKVQNSPTR